MPLFRDYETKPTQRGRDDIFEWFCDPQESFRTLWDSINAQRGFGWASNPWVWVVSFLRAQEQRAAAGGER